MRRKSKVIDLVSLKDKISSEAGEISQNLYKNTQIFVKDVSKGISNIDWDGMYKKAQNNMRSAVKQRNRAFRKSLRKFRKTNVYRVATREVPRYFTQFKRWSSIQLRKLQNLTSVSYRKTKRWASKNTPAIRSFVKEYYPKVENFVLNQSPAYRLVFAK